MTAKDYLRLMWELLVKRYKEYDRAGFSYEYWRITDDYEAAKANWRATKARG
jgi:hypothetical protein